MNVYYPDTVVIRIVGPSLFLTFCNQLHFVNLYIIISFSQLSVLEKIRRIMYGITQ